ncbi:hypothetical protein [Pseudogemmobacter sonorensis]|uniref:hypothetical protein n=1 Tax=Pseudogemmobacter sonorensis TaxID=2989681 RepID=UPI0036CB9366
MQTLYICLAALANVVLNLSLKGLVGQNGGAGIWERMLAAPLSPWFWLAGASGVALISCFMLAIREGSVAVTYIGVTSLAMIGLTLSAAILHHDIPGMARLLGLGLILAGLSLTLLG